MRTACSYSVPQVPQCGTSWAWACYLLCSALQRSITNVHLLSVNFFKKLSYTIIVRGSLITPSQKKLKAKIPRIKGQAPRLAVSLERLFRAASRSDLRVVRVHESAGRSFRWRAPKQINKARGNQPRNNEQKQRRTQHLWGQNPRHRKTVSRF